MAVRRARPPRRPPSLRERARRVLRTRWDILLVISAGGALGSAARWSVADLLPAHPDQIPVATWLANVTGSLILGALMFLVVDVWGPTRYVRPFWGVGVLGGYTTFSTYMLDTRTLVASGAMLAAAVYVVGTVATGIPASWAGLAGTRAVVAAAARRRHTERDVDPDPPPATDAPRSTR